MESRAENVGEDNAELFPGYPIVMVENKKQLYELMDKLSAQEFIGIDSEWKAQYVVPNERFALCHSPAFSFILMAILELHLVCSVALLQISIEDGVYLVDFCSLEMKLVENDWDAFLRALLCSPSRKIGNSFSASREHSYFSGV